MKSVFPSAVLRNLVGCILLSLTGGFIESALAQTVAAQVERLSIAGNVSDVQGGAIVGAEVTITDSRGTLISSLTDDKGGFSFGSLTSGTYSIRITAPGFSAYEARNISLAPNRDQVLNATLSIAPRSDEILVLSENPFARDAEYVGSSFVLRREALDLLFQRPEDFEVMLRALALRSSGPLGPQILINGFEDVPLPSPESIREIRINDNPFAAEYPRLGLGRIEILTKPGTDKLRSQVSFGFGDANLNTRNPFAANRARYQSRVYSGSVSGPIVPKRATFFADFTKQETTSNALINATILDDNTAITPFGVAVVTPERRTSTAPRIDYQLSQRNTIVARYSDTRSYAANTGIGDFSLQSRRQDLTTKSQAIQLTETAVLSSTVVNEIRFQYSRRREFRNGDNSSPVINVPGAFIGGGADIGSAYDREKRAELHESISGRIGRHLPKLGVQLRYTALETGTTQNFGGTYTFNGRLAPVLTAQGEAAVDANGLPIITPITSIEAYRRTILLRNQRVSPAIIRLLGGGASQFSINSGTVDARLPQFQAAGFLQDDWRMHPKFSLNVGVRYDYQERVVQHFDLAPRVAFAWGISRSNEPKTILRGGIGVFYEPVTQRLLLRARQINGIDQTQFFVTESSILDLFPNVPSAVTLSGFAISPSKVQLQRNLRMPYTTHASLSLERQLPRGIHVAATYSALRTTHLLRSRNINAPLPGSTFQNPVRPIPGEGNIFQYESSGISKQQQLLINLIYRASSRMTLWSTYTNNVSKSDTDGPDSFPENSYNLRADYGRSSGISRHTVYWGGWIRLMGGIDLTPLVVWRSGMPFDITTGRDNNGDSLFTDRPAFATDLSRPDVAITRFGNFDLNPVAGQQIIPRNFGKGPEFLIANLRVSKRFAFNERRAMTLAVQGQNLFNHTNPASPVGNLSSSLFGLSHGSAGDWGFGSNQAGNRRIDLSWYFSF
jgi:hypothetical protein